MPDPARQPDPQLIRLLADDELDSSQREALNASLSSDVAMERAARAGVNWEHQLRQAVQRTMTAGEPPASLRTAVAQTLKDEQPAASATPEIERAIPRRVTAGERSAAPRHRRARFSRLFASPQRVNVFAVAAVLALVAGAVLFGIFGRTIDDVRRQTPLDLVANAAEYVDGEHGLCTVSGEGLRRKITYTSPQETEAELTRYLEEPVRVFDLSALGYEFLGGSKCDVPLDQQPSGHLLYRKPDGGTDSGPMVSVFMAPARGCCSSICQGLRPNEWVSATGRPCQHRVLYSTDGRMVYFLVCCNDADVNAVARTLSIAQSAGTR